MQFLKLGQNMNSSIVLIMDIDGENKSLNIVLRWQNILKQWTMTVKDEVGNDLITHIPLISGIDGLTADLLRVYAYKALGSMCLYPLIDEARGIDPTKENLKENYAVAWGDSQ